MFLFRISSIIILAFGGSFSTINAQTDFNWVGKSYFDTISFPGKKHIVIQKCIPSVDSMVYNGTLIFSNSYIAHLGKCEYRKTIKDTVLTNVEIRTKGKNGYNSLKAYFDIITENIHTSYSFNNIQISIRFLPVKDLQILMLSSKNKSSSIIRLEWVGTNTER